MTYLIDGTNVCHWEKNKDVARLNLKILLNLLIELRTRKKEFFCFFDASTRHKLKSREETDLYLKLIGDYTWCFKEVTGKIRADDFILLEADSTNSIIIGNDQFKEYVNDYPWLESEASTRLAKGELAGNSLLLPALKIRRKFERDLPILAKTLANLLDQWKSEKEPVSVDRIANPIPETGQSPARVLPLKKPDFSSVAPDQVKQVEPLKPNAAPPSSEPRKPKLGLKDLPPKPPEPSTPLPEKKQVERLPNPPEAQTWFPTKLIRRLDQEIRAQWPQRKGWVLVDLSERKLPPIWIHARHYLRGSESAASHGYRVEQAEGAAFHLPSADDDYTVVFVRAPGQPIAEAAKKLLFDAQQQSLAWLTIELRGDSEAEVFRRDGSSHPLTKDEAPLAAQEIEVALIGDVSRRRRHFLPFKTKLASNGPNALFTVELAEPAGFSRKSYHFVFSSDQPLGQGAVEVDVRLRVGQPDEIILRNLDFVFPVEVDVWEIPPCGEKWEIIGEEPLVLHVLFDRTSIDAEFWVTALATFDNVAQSHTGRDAKALGLAEVSVPPQKWNQPLRKNLADALTEILPELHNDVTMDLWWFADIERSGIVRPDRVPTTKSSTGQAGISDASQLADRLLSQSFNYAPGLDWFDAVDEGLLQIEESIRHSQEDGRQQHLILIVGDSPPPPKNTDDPIWQQLVDRPLRTNARRSPKFQDALQSLRRIKIPVCWLFFRATPPPEDTVFPDYLSLFSVFETLKERALKALEQIDGLSIEGCSGTKEGMARGLRKLFLHLKAGSGAFPLARIIRD